MRNIHFRIGNIRNLTSEGMQSITKLHASRPWYLTAIPANRHCRRQKTGANCPLPRKDRLRGRRIQRFRQKGD